MYGGTYTNLLYKATKLLQWALAVSIMVIARVEYNVLTLAIFSLDWKIFMTSVVYGYCIILTAQVLCLSTLDRAPHQVYLVMLKVQGDQSGCSLGFVDIKTKIAF